MCHVRVLTSANIAPDHRLVLYENGCQYRKKRKLSGELRKFRMESISYDSIKTLYKKTGAEKIFNYQIQIKENNTMEEAWKK